MSIPDKHILAQAPPALDSHPSKSAQKRHRRKTASKRASAAHSDPIPMEKTDKDLLDRQEEGASSSDHTDGTSLLDQLLEHTAVMSSIRELETHILARSDMFGNAKLLTSLLVGELVDKLEASRHVTPVKKTERPNVDDEFDSVVAEATALMSEVKTGMTASLKEDSTVIKEDDNSNNSQPSLSDSEPDSGGEVIESNIVDLDFLPDMPVRETHESEYEFEQRLSLFLDEQEKLQNEHASELDRREEQLLLAQDANRQLRRKLEQDKQDAKELAKNRERELNNLQDALHKEKEALSEAEHQHFIENAAHEEALAELEKVNAQYRQAEAIVAAEQRVVDDANAKLHADIAALEADKEQLNKDIAALNAKIIIPFTVPELEKMLKEAQEKCDAAKEELRLYQERIYRTFGDTLPDEVRSLRLQIKRYEEQREEDARIAALPPAKSQRELLEKYTAPPAGTKVEFKK